MKPLRLKKMPKHGDDEEIDSLFIPSPEELAELDEADDLEVAESIAHELDDGGAAVVAAWAEALWKVAEARGKLAEYEAGEWWHGCNLSLDSEEVDRDLVLDYDEKGREIWVEAMPPLPRPRELSPEEKVARDRATEEDLLAFERELYGPFWYVERNTNPAKPTVGSEWLSAKAKAQAGNSRKSKSGAATLKKSTRKSRKKPVFWSPKKGG